jgi:hypothetical protein
VGVSDPGGFSSVGGIYPGADESPAEENGSP